MKSQPVYDTLQWDPAGREHILLLTADDEALARRLLSEPPGGAIIFICLDPDGRLAAEPGCGELPVRARRHWARDLPTALLRLDEALSAAPMGARLYIAGSQDLIWQACHVADRFAISRQQLRLQCSGTLSRPVFCVHCRVLTRAARTNVVACSGCGRALFVRDHFSRRLGAYMGLQVDAESPGLVPAIEEVYP